MIYTTFRAGEKEYKLRMTASSICELEEKIGGKNPLSLLQGISENNLPRLSDLMMIFWGCLIPLNNKIGIKDAYTIYDEYIDGGGTLTDFIMILVDAFQVSGFLPKDETGDVKNDKRTEK